MPDSMRSGGITRGSACPSARSRTMPAPSSAISPRFRKRWRPSPIVSAIGCPPSGGGSTSGWSMPRLSARYRSHRDMTIIHGDAHVWNALVSRDAALNDVRLIDWDAWRIDTATDDLAYMIAVHWFPDWRRRYERESLRRYHDALIAAGVGGYSFDALWQD